MQSKYISTINNIETISFRIKDDQIFPKKVFLALSGAGLFSDAHLPKIIILFAPMKAL